MNQQAKHLFSYPKYWAECYETAPFLPMSQAEMDQLGWDSCDIIIVTGDAYVDHPSFGMAVIGRFLEAQGFRVGIIAQPDWRSAKDFSRLGKPNLFFGVTGGNMDSMINRYTADLRFRSDDAYTPGAKAGMRPDRSIVAYSQRCREAFHDVPVVVGGIEASLRRIAQYDYWSDKVRRSALLESGADILLYGNAERALAELAHTLAAGKPISTIKDLRGTAVLRDHPPQGWTEIDASRVDWPTDTNLLAEYGQKNPYQHSAPQEQEQNLNIIPLPLQGKHQLQTHKTCVRLPSFEKVSRDSVLYAHASRILHLESNPYNARVLVQRHGKKDLWVNPPPIPLQTDELDGVFDLAYARRPHPAYGDQLIPAYEMIKTSVNIMRGCFGGCTFCSITEHEGRIVQNRSEDSILKEIESMRDKVPGFTGAISDLGGPTANMYRLHCKDHKTLSSCRRLSCVYPGICKNLQTDHRHTTQLYRKARQLKGIKKIAIASGLRYDLALRDPEYIQELVTHHVGGYLKIAPEHTEPGPLKHMMKPSIDSYQQFKRLFEKFSREAGKKQYLIPYFIAAHPGCDTEDMLNLASWLKQNNFRIDQVQTFYPSPMSLATAMYYSGRNPLRRISYKSPRLHVPKKLEERRLQKAFLRYHDPKNRSLLRKALIEMNRKNLIGSGDRHLIPEERYTKSYTDKNHLHRPLKGKRSGKKQPAGKRKKTRRFDR